MRYNPAVPITHRDPADRPEASYRPQIAEQCDTWEDVASEIVEGAISTAATVALPHNPQLFRQLVGAQLVEAVAAGLEDAANGAGAGSRSEHEIVNRLIVEVCRTPNPVLTLRCLPIVFSLPSGQESQRELAREFGLSPGDVSKLCITLCERFGVERGRGMRTPATRQVYADRQRGKRAKPRPIRYAWSGMMSQVKSCFRQAIDAAIPQEVPA